MLVALSALRLTEGFVLKCVHVNHGIRPPDENLTDASAVKGLCKKLVVPCRVVSFPQGKITAFAARHGTGIEAAARFFRQKAFRAEAGRIKADFILTAHTLTDVHETILMRVLRGSAPTGLAAMPSVKGRLLRPLLELTRQDVLDYLAEKGIPYRTDSTNADTRFLRNRIRHNLVPVLDEFFPSWRSSIMALAQTQSLTADFLSAEAEKRLKWEGSGLETLLLPAANFFSAPPILREEALFSGATMLENKRPLRRSAVRSAVRDAMHDGAEQSEAGQGRSQDLGGVRFTERDGFVELTLAHKKVSERGFSLVITEAGEYTLKGNVLGLNSKEAKNKTVLRVLATDITSAGNPVGSFRAALPLVLRSHRGTDLICKGGDKRRFSDILKVDARAHYAKIITAEDKDGTSAFICFAANGELLVISADTSGESACCLFQIFGGLNVQ
jgi:tRNA(Ile)-lysidine synthase